MMNGSLRDCCLILISSTFWVGLTKSAYTFMLRDAAGNREARGTMANWLVVSLVELLSMKP